MASKFGLVVAVLGLATVAHAQEDTAAPAPRVLLPAEQTVRAMVFSSDGSSLFVADADGAITSFGTSDFEPHAPVKLGMIAGTYRLAVSPLDDRLAVHTLDGKIVLIETPFERPPQIVPLAENVDGPVDLMRFSADGQDLIVHTGGERLVWSVADKSLVRTPLTIPAELQTPRFFSETGRYVAGADDLGSVSVFDAVTGSRVATLDRATGPVQQLAFSHDNGFVAAICESPPGMLQVWQLPEGRVSKLIPLEAREPKLLQFVDGDDGVVLITGAGEVLNVSFLMDRVSGQATIADVAGSLDLLEVSSTGMGIAYRNAKGELVAQQLPANPAGFGMEPGGFFIVPVHYATNRARLPENQTSWQARLRAFLFSQWGWGFFFACAMIGYGVRFWKNSRLKGLATMALLFAAAATLHVMWYQRPTTDNRHRNIYSADVGPLEYGRCEVSVPASRSPGSLDVPARYWIYQEEEKPELHFILQKVEPTDPSAFHAEMNKRLHEGEGTEALIFVHGYNVSFDDAVLRTAQLAVDLQLNGPACAFSWPSYADTLKYTFDATNAEVSIAPFQQFLADIVERCEARRIHLIAHSMGNRVVTRALANLRRSDVAGKLSDKVHEVILAAPDVDERVFVNELLPAFVNDHHVTLYGSNHDRALVVSRWFNGYRRAGDTEPEMCLHDKMDSIDASDVDTSFLGHSYYGDERSVVTDIFSVIRGVKPTERFHLKLQRYGPKPFWRLSPPKS